MTIFNGNQFAAEREEVLAAKIGSLADQGKNIQIAAIVFPQDSGSALYTQKKRQAAERVGISYQIFEFNFNSHIDRVLSQIANLNHDQNITGIIIQKPTKKSWIKFYPNNKVSFLNDSFNTWWQQLTKFLDPKKDVDGLHPATLAAIKNNTWQQQGKVLPATAKAVLSILADSQNLENFRDIDINILGKVLVLNRSDILGLPIFYYLRNLGVDVEMWGRKEFLNADNYQKKLSDFHTIITATGKPGLITGEMVGEGVVVIDAGEPLADVDFESVKKKASFITPVPGGVGPVTVISLLENSLDLW